MAAVTATTIAAVAAVAGAGLAAYGAYQQGQTATKVGDYNARVRESEAKRVEMETRESLRRQRDANKRLVGRQRAQLAKSGVIEEGSPVEVLAETSSLLELEALDYSRSSEAETRRLRSSAGMDRFEGRQAAMAGNINAGASLLQGAGGAARIYA